MAKTILENDGCVSVGSIDREGDLKLRPGLLNINPPPSDFRCECCGRHVNELKPFGKAGDPLVGDFDGALLVKRGRAFAPRDEKTERIYQEYLDRARSESHYEEAEQPITVDCGMEEGGPVVSFSVEDIRDIHERVARFQPADHFRKEGSPAIPTVDEILAELMAANYGTEEAESITRAVAERAEELMALDLGTKEAERLILTVCAAGQVGSSWECRDCIVLSGEEYHEKLRQRWEARCKIGT
jgi:hypothetical protein